MKYIIHISVIFIFLFSLNSCTKVAPLQKKNTKGIVSYAKNGVTVTDENNFDAGITDPENEEDVKPITDPENEEDKKTN